MKIINASPARVIPLGIQGENLAVAISFDLTSYHAEYGAGQAQLLVQRSEDKVPYPVNLKTSDHCALWEVSKLDTSIPGFGRAELRWSVGEVLVKSAIYSFCVFESLGDASDPPEMWQTWLDEILEAASDLQGEQGGWYTPAVTQPDANTMRVSFSPSKEDMPAVEPADITIPSGGGSGSSGEDGGYYTPEVTQTSENTMQVAFSPSKTSMPAVSGTEITLPAGQKGDKGDTGATGADGKSAYAYAVEGGFTGTEAEFAAKLAQETYSKSEIDAIMGAYINDIDTLVGGEG